MKQLFLRYLKNPLLYVGFVGGILLTMYVIKPDARGFDLFPTKIAQQSVEVGQMHLVHQKFLGDFVAGITYGGVNYEGILSAHIDGTRVDVNDMKSLLAFTDLLEQEATVNLSRLINSSSDNVNALKNYLKKITTLSEKSSTILDLLANRLHLLEMEYRACKSNKEGADARYVRGLERNDGSNVEGGYQDAMEYGDCVTKLRIQIKAYAPIKEKISSLTSVLIQRKDFLEQNISMLISQPDIFEGKKLEEMIQIRDAIQKQ